jgi:hypothetical protein
MISCIVCDHDEISISYVLQLNELDKIQLGVMCPTEYAKQFEKQFGQQAQKH